MTGSPTQPTHSNLQNQISNIPLEKLSTKSQIYVGSESLGESSITLLDTSNNSSIKNLNVAFSSNATSSSPFLTSQLSPQSNSSSDSHKSTEKLMLNDDITQELIHLIYDIKNVTNELFFNKINQIKDKTPISSNSNYESNNQLQLDSNSSSKNVETEISSNVYDTQNGESSPNSNLNPQIQSEETKNLFENLLKKLKDKGYNSIQDVENDILSIVKIIESMPLTEKLKERGLREKIQDRTKRMKESFEETFKNSGFKDSMRESITNIKNNGKELKNQIVDSFQKINPQQKELNSQGKKDSSKIGSRSSSIFQRPVSNQKVSNSHRSMTYIQSSTISNTIESHQPPSLPLPSHSSSYNANKKIYISSTNEYITPPKHSHSSFTDIALIKAICISFSTLVPSFSLLQEMLEPLYFINDPGHYMPNCIHHMPQIIVGLSSEATYKKDLLTFDQMVQALKMRFPFIQPYFLNFFEDNSKNTNFSTESYIINISIKNLSDHLLQFKKSALSQFRSNSKKIIDNPEKVNLSKLNLDQKNSESISKQIRGDYYMLTGHFNRAREEFEVCIETSKITNDWLSQAMSFEGIAACYWFDAKKNFPNGKIPENILQKIIKSYQSFLQIIEKRSELKLFYVYMLLRLSQFYADIKDMSLQYTNEALSLINETIMLSSIQTVQTRVTVFGIAALISLQLGCTRKYGYYLRHVSQLHYELGFKQNLAIYYLSLSFESYKVPLEYVANKVGGMFQIISKGKSEIDFNKYHMVSGWMKLQVECIKDVISMLLSLFPPAILEVIQLSFFLLSYWYNVIPKEDQQQIFNRICHLSGHLTSGQSPCITSLPLVQNLVPNQLPAQRQPHLESNGQVKKKLFEYTNISFPDENKIVNVRWVRDDIATIILSLHNPFSIQLQLISVSLEANIPCTVYPVAASLSPKGTTELTISIRPHSITESFEVKNVLITFAHNSKFIDPIKIEASFPSEYAVEIIPSLPILDIELSEKTVEIYEGEIKKFKISLSNVGSVPIDNWKCYLSPTSGDSLKDFVSFDPEYVLINPGQSIISELSVNATTFLSDSNYQTNHIGNIQDYKIHFEYRNKDCIGWRRELSTTISILTKPSLILDACVSMNLANRKQIVGRISNFSTEPIMLLSILKEGKNEDQYLDYSKGVTIGPSHTKIVLLKNHIPFEVIEKIPYSVKYLNRYSKYFCQHLKWKGTVSNANGIVSIRSISDQEIAMEELDDDSTDDIKETESVELEDPLPNSFTELTLTYNFEDSEVTISTKDQVNSHLTKFNALPLYEKISCSITIQSSLSKKKIGSVVNINILQEGGKGESQASSKQFMHSGVLSFPLDISKNIQEHSCDIWFLVQGKYHIQVSCVTKNGESPITEPKKISLICK